MGQNYKNDTPRKEEAKEQPEILQPWKANCNQSSPLVVCNQVQEGQKMVIMEGGGSAYPNTIKEDEGRRL